MPVRGIRGAIQVAENSRESVLKAAETLLTQMQRANHLKVKDIAAVFLTMTSDLNAEFPAYATRQMREWKHVPLLCAQELNIPNAMPRVLRALMLANMNKGQAKVKHQYLGETACLRPDLAKGNLSTP